MVGKKFGKLLTLISLLVLLSLVASSCSRLAGDSSSSETDDGANGRRVPASRVVVAEKGEPGEIVWLNNYQVAYTVQDIFAGKSQLKLLDLVTGQAVVLDENNGDSALAASPDGCYLAYPRIATGASPQPSPDASSPEDEHLSLNLMVYNLTTKKSQVAVEGLSAGPVDIAWSPQGDRIAFCDLRGLWVAQIEPGAQAGATLAVKAQLLVPSTDASSEQAQVPRKVRWSPDGKWLAYSLGLWEGFGWVLKVGAQGGEPVRITRISDVWPQGWSPDGKRLLLKLTPYGSEELEELWLLEVESQKEERLGEGKYQAVAGAWLPDGNLVVAITQDDQVRVMKYFLDTGKQELVVTEKGCVYDLALSPDGRMVAYQVRGGTGGAPGAPGAPPEAGGCSVVVQPLNPTI
ncbi:MAG: PD40 domain-containing protein [Clostridia bacterium]|nr:PD40 domain-containing protein [Clostridia bacterium]